MRKAIVSLALLAPLVAIQPERALAQDADGTEKANIAASTDPHVKPRRVTLGVNIDLFPIVASATQGQFGFAGQLQLAIDRVQLRLVGAKLRNFAFLHAGVDSAAESCAPRDAPERKAGSDAVGGRGRGLRLSRPGKRR